MLVATLAARLGIEALAGRLVRLWRSAGRRERRPQGDGAAVCDGAGRRQHRRPDVLRAGRTRRLLGGWLPAPSTLGTFLRAFTFGHVRQLDALIGQRARARLERRGGTGRRAAGDRRRQLRRRGLRLAEAGRRLRVHEAVGVSPDSRHPRRHQGGAAHPLAEGVGEHAEGDASASARSWSRASSRRARPVPSCCGPTGPTPPPTTSRPERPARDQHHPGVGHDPPSSNNRRRQSDGFVIESHEGDLRPRPGCWNQP